MADLLFELGCEELPAISVRRAYEQLAERISARLTEAGIGFGEVASLGTPRRLIVGIRDIQEQQPDQSKSQRGPAIRAAYDESGQPTKALEGFCRGQGAELSELTNDGEYVWFEKLIKGQATAELLAEILPASVRDLTFDKTMRWGSSRMRFARPIRWMLASFAGNLVPFEIEGVASGLESRGHRFYHPETFEAKSLDALLAGLRDRKVEPCPVVREERIRTEAAKVASGTPQLKDELVDENVFLTEWPVAIEGEFPSDYLALPEPVLVTAMAKHERFFPVRDASGKLTNRFISIRNAGEDEAVRLGNQWVLNARFNDAEFFHNDDATKTMADFLEKTSRMAFQDKLGTVRQRADRLAELAAYLAQPTGLDPELARQAGLYAKADLSSGLVSEFASLQGIIGGAYAEREGMAPDLSQAVAGQYELATDSPTTSGDKLARILLLADQMDKLVGFVGIGHVPSGSSDPFGLRRAVTLIIQSCWSWPTATIDIREALRFAQKGYADQDIALSQTDLAPIEEIFTGRYPALMPEARYDLLDAAVTADAVLSPITVRDRLALLGLIASEPALVQAASRPFNILAAAEKKGTSIPEWDDKYKSVLTEPSENELLGTAQSTSANLGQPGETQAAFRALAPKIDAFFDSVMVMDEREAYRTARLALLGLVRQKFAVAGDLSKIVIEG